MDVYGGGEKFVVVERVLMYDIFGKLDFNPVFKCQVYKACLLFLRGSRFTRC